MLNRKRIKALEAELAVLKNKNDKKIEALETELAALKIEVDCLAGRHAPMVHNLTFDTITENCKHCYKHLSTYKKQQEQNNV